MMNGKPIVVQANIAGLRVLMHCKTAYMVSRLERYKAPFAGAAEVEIDIPARTIAAYCEKHRHLQPAMAEYMLSGTDFYGKLYKCYNGIMLHASAIEKDGRGYVFSANSGTGKSTHTALWKAQFGDSVRYINDDKPALRLLETGWHVFGTPWSGKTDLNENACVPLQAIAFLHRSTENTIARLGSGDALPLLMEQTIRPTTQENIEAYFALVEQLLTQIPVYSMGCNMTADAVRLAYETMQQ